MLRTAQLLSRRCFASVHKEEVKRIADSLFEQFPTEDPNKLKPAKLERMLKNTAAGTDKSAMVEVLRQWRILYERNAHDSAYEDMADPGELCDGELPSWRNARLSVERDPTVVVPDVSASEAALKLKNVPHKSDSLRCRVPHTYCMYVY